MTEPSKTDVASSFVSCKTSASSDSGAPQSRPPDAEDSGGILSLSDASLAVTDLIFGLHAVELWSYDESTGKLLQVPLASGDEEAGLSSGGLLVKRRTQESDPANGYARHDEALTCVKKLTDPSRKDFLPPLPTDPGVGLPGILWAEQHSRAPGGAGGAGVTWRDTGELAEDPHQPYDERLQSFAKAGFRLAAGVPFDINGYRGIVIFFGNPHADRNKLRHPSNSEFIGTAAQLIGCVAAIQGPKKRVEAFREEVRYQNWHRMKVKLMTVIRFGGGLRQTVEREQADKVDSDKSRSSIFSRQSSILQFIETSYREGINLGRAKENLKHRGARWTKKVRGGGAGVPPPPSTRQCLWTFLGVMTTHTILSRINLLVQTETDGELSLILAPLGALTALQYCLTAAPAAQPRNAFFAQVFALTTTILLGYIPDVEPWFRSALAPAIVIPGMAKLGIVHPPAAAAAIVFSSGRVRWEHFGIFLCGVAVSIVTAVGINNMSDKRQYPTSWYLLNKARDRLRPDE